MDALKLFAYHLGAEDGFLEILEKNLTKSDF